MPTLTSSPPSSPKLQAGSTIVIKLGTSSVIDEHTYKIRHSIIRSIASTVARLRERGYRVVLVSSGAVGFGVQRMGLDSQPKSIASKQALAAIGQGELISTWATTFAEHSIAIGQILITHDDITSPKRYTNATQTFNELLALNVVPIVNENDTLSTTEIRIGDNDTLGAVVAAMIKASYLFLLTDVDALYASNPKRNAHAPRIDLVPSISDLKARLDAEDLGAGSSCGTGGMKTKLRAAEIAAKEGIFTVITGSGRPSVVEEILEYYRMEEARADVVRLRGAMVRPSHTLFTPTASPRQSPSLGPVEFQIPDFEI